MTHPHRYYLFADAAGAAWVRALAVQLWGGGEAEMENCKSPISLASDPTGDVLYFAMSFVCTEAQRLLLESIEGAGQVPASVFYTRVGAETGVVAHSNHPFGQANLGLVWDTATALAGLGLAFHETPYQPPPVG